MNDVSVSRRRWLLASATVPAWLASACAVTAGGPAVSAPAAGITRVDLGGGVVATTLSDGVATRPLDANFVRNAPFAAVQAALAEAGLPTDKLEVPFVPVLVDIGGQRVLFDVGNGEFGAPNTGQLLARLAQAGVAPGSITAVVFSHFHGDHINGLRSRAGALVFPNAKLFAPAPEWDFWMDDQRMAAAPDALRGNFNAVRRVFGPIAASVQRFQPGAEVLPGVRSVAALGHTPGHTAFIVQGGRERLMYWGDATNIAALFVRNPDWAVMFDMDPEAARRARRQLADQAIRENLLLCGYHLPGSAIGRLAVRGQGYEFTPLKAG